MTAVIRTYRPGEEKYVADLHERLYAEEYGWGPAFVTYAKEIALDFPRRPENGREGLWIAEVEGVKLVERKSSKFAMGDFYALLNRFHCQTLRSVAQYHSTLGETRLHLDRRQNVRRSSPF